MNISALARRVGDILQKNSPQILTGLGVAGVVSTAIMTARATNKATHVIDNEARSCPREHLNQYGELAWRHKVRVAWTYYIPPAIMCSMSVACIIGAQSVNTKRNAAIASLYSLTKSTLEEYQDKVVETIGEKKEELIRGEISQKKLDAKPVSKEYIIDTGRGKTLCFDTLSGRYFRHDMEVIRRIVNDLNHDLLGVMWVPLNDLYYALGLEGVKMGDEMGWTVDELIEIKFTSKISDDGEPCLVLDYDVSPRSLKTRNWSGL